jgi:hypothetical protein
MLHQYYWDCNFYSAYGQSVVNLKNLLIFISGAANSPRRVSECIPLFLYAQGAAQQPVTVSRFTDFPQLASKYGGSFGWKQK